MFNGSFKIAQLIIVAKKCRELKGRKRKPPALSNFRNFRYFQPAPFNMVSPVAVAL